MADVVSRGGSRLAAWPEEFGLMEPQMRTSELKQLLAMTHRLTLSQREEPMAQLTDDVARDAVGAVIQHKLARHPDCSKCGGQHTVRNVQASGLQRYKCRGCGVTFNALTGTPLARVRRRDKWFEQVQAMDEGLRVRKSAARMAVHRTTVFRWRHRFPALPREAKAQQLSGVADGDESYVLRFYKGQHRWIKYLASFYKSALYPTLRQLDLVLARWAARKYKKLRGHLRRTRHWLARVAQTRPGLFAHWKLVQPTAG